MGSAIEQILATTDEKVKASSTDNTPDYLDGKVDGTTITVNGSDKLQREALTGGVTTIGNAATVVTNANLTGGVTSIGNAATVVTNANLTGVVTSVGNATAIADKALAIAKLADGVDGELITWDASGVIDTVAAGTAGQVLTSNGAGAAPTMQDAGGGAASNVILQSGLENTNASYVMEQDATVYTGSYTATPPQYNYWYKNASTGYVQMLPTKTWVKAPGFNTLTLHIKYWGDAAAGQWHRARLTVDTINGTETTATTSTTPVDGTSVVNVSSLTDGVEYNVFIKMRRQSTSSKVMCGEWYIVAS
jgi:uncharacterized protein YccT (UPF0319 family)